jgi:hypothetical protein
LRRMVLTNRSATAFTRGAARGPDDPDALCTEDDVEESRELGVSIPDEELDRVRLSGGAGALIGKAETSDVDAHLVVVADKTVSTVPPQTSAICASSRTIFLLFRRGASLDRPIQPSMRE